MKGNNTLIFNGATMQAAVQLYLEKIMKEPPKVVSVAQSSSNRNEDNFKIEVTSAEDTSTSGDVA